MMRMLTKLFDIFKSVEEDCSPSCDFSKILLYRFVSHPPVDRVISSLFTVLLRRCFQ